MIDIIAARDIALSKMSDKTFFNFCTEYENAFVFSKYDDMSIGGNGPCAVMKNDGSALNFAAVLDEIGDELHDYKMSLDGEFTEVPIEQFDGD